MNVPPKPIELNDTIEYDEAELMDDRERDALRMDLAGRDLATYDTGGELTIGWLFALDGSRVEQGADNVFSDNQPSSAKS